MTKITEEANEKYGDLYLDKKICFIAGANSKTVDEMILKAIRLGRYFTSVYEIGEVNMDFSEQEILEKAKQEFL